MKIIAFLKNSAILNHFDYCTMRILAIFLLTAMASSLPYADAAVNPNNFSVSFGSEVFYCMPRYNAGVTDHYNQAAMESVLTTAGTNDIGPSRKAAITRRTENGAFRYAYYTLYNTTSVDSVTTRTFKGYWFTRESNHHVQANEYKGQALSGGGGKWYFGVVNDEYGNLIFATALYHATRKPNFFPNYLHPVMVDGQASDEIRQVDTSNDPISPRKYIQVWGPNTDRYYPTNFSVTGGYRGSCQILQASGDFGTYDDQAAISAGRYGKGGYVWFTPYQIPDRAFRVKLRYSSTEADNVTYQQAEEILFDGKLEIPKGVAYCSCIGYGDNDNRMMVHVYGQKIWMCKYGNFTYDSTNKVWRAHVTEAYEFYNGHGVTGNARFAYGAPTAFSLQGHNFLVTADEPYGTYMTDDKGNPIDAGSGGMKVYEILENASGEIYLNLVGSRNPMTSGDNGTGTKYIYCNSAIHGPAFSTIRHSGYHTQIMGLAWRTGYYTYDFEATLLPTTACTYTGTYKQNGTSTPTLRRIIVCNPPSGGEALSYYVFNSSNTDLTSGLTNVDARTYIDDNASRCTSSSTYSYYSKGVYECDGHARTALSGISPAGPTASAPAIPAPLTNTTPTVNTFNYYDVSRAANSKYSYSITQSGSAGSFKQYNLSVNGTASSVATNVTSGQQAGFLTSFAVTPVYHIDGHNDSAVSTNWDYYGTNRVLPTVDDVDYDCPKPSSVSPAQNLKTTSAEVQQMNLTISWPTLVESPKATRNGYEVIVTDETTNEIIYTNSSVSPSATSEIVPDVWVGHTYSALVRSNYTYNGVTGHYSNIVPSAQIIPDYTADAPRVNVSVKEAPNGTVAIWDEDHGWHNVTTPIYRMEVTLNEPADTTHQPVSYYQLQVNKNDGNGWQPFSAEELTYFPAGSGNITPAQLTSTVIEPESGQPCTFYFYWDG
ncbi:MAG: hypothetical protein J5784_01635, partial [Muribaculaceae bacterium]|nr:hypothetical protein [Muribaculaceae bacterium]